MHSFLVSNHEWILGLRSEFLTYIFKIFPFFASDYFYIAIIALGYWIRPRNSLFISLGFLVPFSTLFNCLLKNLFQIPRPDNFMHLIQVHDNFGFPSGDVQVATVFWLLIFSNLKTSIRYFCFLPIIAIGFSRIYLGVHSIYDIFGGFIFGFLTFYFWIKFDLQSTTRQKYWLVLLVTICIYEFVSYNLKTPPMVPMAIGALIGFGCSLSFINKPLVGNLDFKTTNHIKLILGLAAVITLAKLIPVFKTNDLFLFCSMTLKYTVIVFCIFEVIPKTINKFRI